MPNDTTTAASTDLINEFLDLWPFEGEPEIAPVEEEEEEVDLEAFLIAQQTWAP
jgi:hypothetical protein